MWASAILDDDFEIVKEDSISLEEEEVVKYQFPINGDGWFETTLGCSADVFVKRFRKARRHNKDDKSEIDSFIKDIRAIKSLETEMTLHNLSWGKDLHDVMKQLGLSDKKLKSLRKFGDTRQISLLQACNLWKDAERTLKMLDQHEDVWGKEEEQAWATAMGNRSAARKMWSTTLNQIDKLTKAELGYLEFVVNELKQKGPMRPSDMRVNLHDAGLLKKSFTDRKLTALLNMYGEELDIIKGAERGTYVLISTQGLIMKDVWAYSAGFLDADGYITITERGEPRAGMIATGARGKIHCEDLYKHLECGVLQLDNKVYKESQRSQHRLQFYSKNDLRKLLNGVSPHLKMKSMQAKCVLAYLDEKDPVRKQEIKRLVRFENWKDDAKKSRELLEGWGIDEDTIGKYREGL
mgnify:FL=1